MILFGAPLPLSRIDVRLTPEHRHRSAKRRRPLCCPSGFQGLPARCNPIKHRADALQQYVALDDLFGYQIDAVMKTEFACLSHDDVSALGRFYTKRLGFQLAFKDKAEQTNYVGFRRDAVELHMQFQFRAL
jgi:hypothetical protein